MVEDRLTARLIHSDPSGRALGVPVVRYVLGWQDLRRQPVYPWPTGYDKTFAVPPGCSKHFRVPDFSACISPAWDVVEHLRKEGYDFECR
jgi:hypothetical protein